MPAPGAAPKKKKPATGNNALTGVNFPGWGHANAGLAPCGGWTLIALWDCSASTAHEGSPDPSPGRGLSCCWYVCENVFDLIAGGPPCDLMYEVVDDSADVPPP